MTHYCPPRLRASQTIDASGAPSVLISLDESCACDALQDARSVTTTQDVVGFTPCGQGVSEATS